MAPEHPSLPPPPPANFYPFIISLYASASSPRQRRGSHAHPPCIHADRTTCFTCRESSKMFVLSKGDAYQAKENMPHSKINAKAKAKK
eukprot:206307-Chlamydomonas_euryale.AAC.8